MRGLLACFRGETVWIPPLQVKQDIGSKPQGKNFATKTGKAKAEEDAKTADLQRKIGGTSITVAELAADITVLKQVRTIISRSESRMVYIFQSTMS